MKIALQTSTGMARRGGDHHVGGVRPSAGLRQKAPSASRDADVVIYNENKDVAHVHPTPVTSRASRPRKGSLRIGHGRTFSVRPGYDEKIEEYLRPLFQQQYTMSFDNYPVAPERVHGLHVVDPGPSS